MKMKKAHTTIGLLFGGKSAEHEVSVRSAQSIYQVLQQTSHMVKLIYISRNGTWLEADASIMSRPPTEVVALINEHDRSAKRKKVGFYYPSELEGIDVLFPVLHGPNGEDGTIQAFLRMIDIPYVGSAVLGSAICMDKDVSKRLLHEAGIPIVPYIVCSRKEKESLSYSRVSQTLGKILFVKPANLGSSVGVHKTQNEESFNHAVTEAFLYDHKILIEKAIPAREIECAVLGNEDPQASLLGEIIPTHDFYTYESKYQDKQGATTEVPAALTKKQNETMQNMAVQAFQLLECSGMARVDFFVDKDTGALYLNEVNTIPGFTDISMYPKLWEASGLSYADLITRLIELAIEKHTSQASLKTSHN